MIAKSLIAAAALATSLVAVAPEQAKADFNLHDWHVGIHFPHPGIYPGYGLSYQPLNPIYAPSHISCHQGRQTVKWSGFKMVTPIDCQGPTYRYNARKAGTNFRVSVSALSGNITKVKAYY